MNEQKSLIFIAGSQPAYCQVINQSHNELATQLTHIIVEHASNTQTSYIHFCYECALCIFS